LASCQQEGNELKFDIGFAFGAWPNFTLLVELVDVAILSPWLLVSKVN
jgi:hypothetical protein